MNLLIDGSKILSAGNGIYVATGTQQVVIVDDGLWRGKRKSEIKWDGSKMIDKTDAELLADAKTEKKKQLLPSYQQRMINENISTIESEWTTKKAQIDALSDITLVKGVK